MQLPDEELEDMLMDYVGELSLSGGAGKKKRKSTKRKSKSKKRKSSRRKSRTKRRKSTKRKSKSKKRKSTKRKSKRSTKRKSTKSKRSTKRKVKFSKKKRGGDEYSEDDYSSSGSDDEHLEGGRVNKSRVAREYHKGPYVLVDNEYSKKRVAIGKRNYDNGDSYLTFSNELAHKIWPRYKGKHNRDENRLYNWADMARLVAPEAKRLFEEHKSQTVTINRRA
jgi:hypothetical protein